MSAPTAGEPELLDTRAAGPIAIRGGLLQVVAYTGGSALSVCAAALLLRHLGVTDSGSYFAVVALATVVTGVTDLGLAALGLRELTVRSGDDRSRAMRTLLGLRLVLTSVGALAVVGFAVIVGYSSTLVAGTAIAATGVLLQGVQVQLGTSLQSRLRFGAIAGIEFGRQALSASLIAIGVLVGLGLLSFLAVAVVASLVTVSITALLVRGDVPLRPSFDVAISRSWLRDTGTYSMAAAAHVLYLRASVIIVSIVGSATALGTFAAAYRVVEVLIVLPTLAIGAGFPILARAARDDATRFGYALSKLFDAALVLGTWLALMLGLGAPLVIAVVAGPEFSAAADVLRIQSAIVVTVFVGAVWGYALLALGLYRLALRISVTAFVVGCTTTLLLAGSHGAIGAAVATVIGELLVVTLGAIALARRDQAMLPSLRAVPRVALAAGVAIAPAVLLDLPAGAAAATGSVVYLVLVIVLGAVPDELFAEFRRRHQPAA